MSEPLSVPAAIEARVSIRRYTDAPVPDADLHRILELAGKAPSAWNIQPWRFVAVRDPGVKQRLMAAAYNQPQVGGAPVVFVVYSDMLDAMDRFPESAHPGMPAEKREALVQQVRGTFAGQPAEQRESWGNAQTYISVGYLLLAAQSLGYVTSPMLGFDPKAVKELLGIPMHATIPAIVAMGVAAEPGFSQHRLPIDSISRVI